MTTREIAHSTFTLDRRFSAPPAEVFAAWEAPDVRRRWFAGDAAEHELDFRAGGHERVRAEVNGKRVSWEGSYHEIVAGERIVFTGVLSEEDVVATVSLTTVELVADGDGSRLLLTETGAFLDGRERPEWRERGTTGQLEALGRELANAARC